MAELDHKAFVAHLTVQQKTDLTLRSTWRGVLHLIGHMGLVAVCAAWVIFALPFWKFGLIPLGIALFFLFTLEHECTHKTPFANGPVNEWVGRLCGLLLVLPFEWFRFSHLAHHRHTNIIGKYPELLAPPPQTRAQLLIYFRGCPIAFLCCASCCKTRGARHLMALFPPDPRSGEL